jgi:superfamily I DNA/RNA helicase
MSKLTATVAHGDFILSRVNAPLVSVAMSLLRNGKRARIAGRDIGAGLRAIVRKLAKGAAANSVPMFIEKVGTWRDKETARLLPQTKNPKSKNAAENKIALVDDQADMLVSLAEGAVSVRDIESRIDALFTDDGLGAAGVITCSSVHRSKGLEADRVFVLADTLRGGDIEEENIRYVAITRAKNTLVMVRKPVVA